MTNKEQLISELARNGYIHYVKAIAEICDITETTACKKINSKVDFTQSEIVRLAVKLNLSGERVKEIFVGDD